MGDRHIRVGELVLRELSGLLHTRWRSESAAITLTGIDMSPDLKRARVWYSAVGSGSGAAQAGRFLARIRKDLRMKLGKAVVLKYTPEIEFAFDRSAERAMRVEELLDELGAASHDGDFSPDAAAGQSEEGRPGECGPAGEQH